MSQFRIGVHIIPRRGLLDPQGKAVADALHSLDFGDVRDVRVGRYLVIDTELREYADHGELYMCVSGALSRIARGRELRRSYAVEKQVEARAGRTPPLSSGDESLP